MTVHVVISDLVQKYYIVPGNFRKWWFAHAKILPNLVMMFRFSLFLTLNRIWQTFYLQQLYKVHQILWKFNATDVWVYSAEVIMINFCVPSSARTSFGAVRWKLQIWQFSFLTMNQISLAIRVDNACLHADTTLGTLFTSYGSSIHCVCIIYD
jgi:hypothetical protein